MEELELKHPYKDNSATFLETDVDYVAIMSRCINEIKFQISQLPLQRKNDIN